jgi:hypothetical protein
VHAFPHPPQFASSVLVFTHELLQAVSSGPHAETHLPIEHTLPRSHAAPHAPQFAGSAMRLIHDEVHCVVLGGQTHCPPLHLRVGAHEVPQAPQFLGAVIRSTQTPEQKVREGSLHESLHIPCTHAAPLGH